MSFLKTRIMGIYHDPINFGPIMTILGPEFYPWAWTQGGILQLDGLDKEAVISRFISTVGESDG